MRSNGQAVYLRAGSIHISKKTLLRVVALVILLALIFYGGYRLSQQEILPIKKIHALGQFRHINEAVLRDVVAGSLNGGYFVVSMSKVKQDIEKLPWVSVASVRRVWPDTLAITVAEQQAIAVWKKGGLLNKQGDVFTPDRKSYPHGLPVFDGPAGLQRLMMSTYQRAETALYPLQLRVTQIKMDARRAVTLVLSNGMTLLLGRDDTESRLMRFARVYQKVLVQRQQEIKKIDMRYSNGLAISWRAATGG